MTEYDAITTPIPSTRKIIGDTIARLDSEGEEMPVFKMEAIRIRAVRDFALSLPSPYGEFCLDELARRLEAWEESV